MHRSIVRPAMDAGGARLRSAGSRIGRSLALGFVVAAMLGSTTAPALAARWLCPDCTDGVIERTGETSDLDCPACGAHYPAFELTPPVAFLNVSTRDAAEVSWNPVNPEPCRIYRPDGVETISAEGDTVWVPWIAVEYFIPRMRILRLVDGRELKTDYAKTREGGYCPAPPRFSYLVSDSLSLPGRTPSVFEDSGEYSLAELFIVAFNPASRDSARVRFIAEVEAGLHPRLPRTQPRVVRLAEVVTPPSVASPELKAEAVVEARVHERRGITGVHLVQGTGHPVLDQHAVSLAQGCSFSSAGELGVAVPAWVNLRIRYEGTGGSIEVEPARNGFWRR